jgi:hypothetical protein
MKFGFIATSGTIDEVLDIAREAEAHGWMASSPGWHCARNVNSGTKRTPTGDNERLRSVGRTGSGSGADRTGEAGAMIFPLSRRRPWKVAREAMTVDHLSNGGW